ncbi:MAG: hypothetical protein V9G12_25845 [Microthrixaceae bacterium]
MKSKLSVLVLVIVLTVLAATPIAAAPMASPCTPGASYNPACDVNQDGAITILDVQLTAGHWNRTGAFVSDNNHNHLGQTWTGSNNPMKIQGAFGAPDYTPLLLSNSTGHGLAVTSAAIDGIYVGTAGYYGLAVQHADKDGVLVVTAGSPSSSQVSADPNGFEVAGAQGNGLFVGRADYNGVYVSSAAFDGVSVASAGLAGLFVGFGGRRRRVRVPYGRRRRVRGRRAAMASKWSRPAILAYTPTQPRPVATGASTHPMQSTAVTCCSIPSPW